MKLELDDETLEKYKEDNGLDPATTLADLTKEKEDEEEAKGPDLLPGEVK